MVSRRNYFTIAIMMVLVLFMFQFTGVAKNMLNEFETNEYVDAAATDMKMADSFMPTAGSNAALIAPDREYVAYIGSPEDEIGNVVKWWCAYSKWEVVYYSFLKECDFPENHLPKAIILDGANMIDAETESSMIKKYTEDGIHVIFARLPGPDRILSHEILQHDILGISKVLDYNVSLAGMHLFSDFLLGGEAIYEAENEKDLKRQDLNLEVPWYMTEASTKTYLMGTMEEDVENESLPVIIWRNKCGNAYVFCVNGDYLCNMEGMGILSAMMAETQKYQIYPVVNAQSFVAANYPGFSKENEEEIQKRYSQSQNAVFLELVWPVLATMESQISMKLSCMMTPQFDYEDKNEPVGGVEDYLKLLQEVHGEAGLSLDTISNTSLQQKLKRDAGFWKQEAKDYEFLSAYTEDEGKVDEILNAPELSGVRTILHKRSDGREPIISYAKEGVTVQHATSYAQKYTFSDDIMNKSIETVLGYANVIADFSKVAYPVTEEDSWEKLAERITSTVITYWKPFSVFGSATVSESDQRIRRFLALDYKVAEAENEIAVEISNFENEAWFILRTKDEQKLEKISGGSYTKIEENAYLVLAQSNHLTITWKTESQQELHIAMQNVGKAVGEG